MKWPTIVPAWMYRDPQEIVDGLIARSGRIEHGPVAIQGKSIHRDRYYTQARRARIRTAMKGRG